MNKMLGMAFLAGTIALLVVGFVLPYSLIYETSIDPAIGMVFATIGAILLVVYIIMYRKKT